jgi:hypothetical protein
MTKGIHMHARKLAALAAATVALLAAAPAHAKDNSSVAVCNEAENSPRGGYDVVSGDPNPPAQLRGSQMEVGNGRGLSHAADRSPALAPCVPPYIGGGGGF